MALALGDEVFFDTDGNGRRDPGEPGLAGVPVWLNRVVEPDDAADPGDADADADAGNDPSTGDDPAAGDPGAEPPGTGDDMLELVDATVTDADGRYHFDGLAPGATYVVEIPASAFADGEPLDGSTARPATARSRPTATTTASTPTRAPTPARGPSAPVS
ncbi:MAG: hypothetical protein S0880_17920 [Actinomycetota bacterium]|nr:hypothetical protein [Actinomycetota bacterium]